MIVPAKGLFQMHFLKVRLPPSGPGWGISSKSVLAARLKSAQLGRIRRSRWMTAAQIAY